MYKNERSVSWFGVGTALIPAIGIAYFNNGLSAIKVASIGSIILGVVGLILSRDVH